MPASTFDSFGPFADGLDSEERNRRLDRLAAASGGTDAAAYIEMIRLTKWHERNMAPLLATLNGNLDDKTTDAVKAAYAASGSA